MDAKKLQAVRDFVLNAEKSLKNAKKRQVGQTV